MPRGQSWHFTSCFDVHLNFKSHGREGKVGILHRVFPCFRSHGREGKVGILHRLFYAEHPCLLHPRPLGMGCSRLAEQAGNGGYSWSWSSPFGGRGDRSGGDCHAQAATS